MSSERVSGTVFVTGAGGVAVPGLIEHIRAQGFRVIAGDMDELAPGLYFADRGFVLPAGTASDFRARVFEICQREKVDVLIPLVDEELITARSLDDGNLQVMMPDTAFVEVALDKLELMHRLSSAGIPCPATRLASDTLVDVQYPAFVKPRRGRGSRGIATAEDASTLDRILESSDYEPDQLLVQDYIDGTEFTVSVVVWRDGEVQAVVPKEIIRKKGITQLAVTRHHEGIRELCHRIQKELRADGPFNVQLKIDVKTKSPMVFEINPRFSTTASLTIAAGIDEIGGLVRQAIWGRGSWQFGDWREGVVLSRRNLDVFVDEEEFNYRRTSLRGSI